MNGSPVGILHPNDGNCHLGQDGYHTKSKYLDYPSVSQINYVAKQVCKLVHTCKLCFDKLIIDGARVALLMSSNNFFRIKFFLKFYMVTTFKQIVLKLLFFLKFSNCYTVRAPL